MSDYLSRISCCKDMYSLFVLRTIYFFIFVGCLHTGNNFHTNWTRRSREYERAKTYLQTETCTNPRVRAKLGTYHRCDESERTMDDTPVLSAFKDSMENLHVCGNGYCEMLGMNITNSLPQVMLTLAIFGILVVWASGISFRRRRDREAEEYYSLPVKRR